MGAKQEPALYLRPMRTIAAILSLLTLCSGIAQSNIQLERNQDPFDDSDRSRVIVMADEQPAFGTGNAIIWRCQGNDEYELFVVNEEFLGGDRVPVRIRFDQNEARSSTWVESTNGTAAFAGPGQATVFTRDALDANQVILRLTDYRGRRYDYQFSLAGLHSHLTDLGCVDIEPYMPPLTTSRSLGDAYSALMEIVADEHFTEGLNVVYFEDLTVRFEDTGNLTRLTFEGTDRELYERIRRDF